MADRVGTQVGHYRLTGLLGQGGFAEVYLGEQVHLGTQAAIKLLHAPLAHAPQVEAFRQEAKRIAQLSHPHIVRVFDFGFEGELPYLVLEYAPGGSLRQRHPVGTPVPLATVFTYVGQIAEALQYAHDQQVIHRDLKPQNLLLGRRGEVLLADFGISVVAESTSRQSSKEFAGTVAYAAPEQIQGHPRPASDQYALGIVVYEWLTGHLPFTGSLPEIIWKQMQAPPSPLRTLMPGVPAAVEQVILTTLAKGPKERFSSVRAFATALSQASQAAVPSIQVVASQPGPPPTGIPAALQRGDPAKPPSAEPATPKVVPPPTVHSPAPAATVQPSAGAHLPPTVTGVPSAAPAGWHQAPDPPPAPAETFSLLAPVPAPVAQAGIRAFARSSLVLADGEIKRAKMWTPVFTRTFLALFLVGTVLGGWARAADCFCAFHNPDGAVYNKHNLHPPFVVLLFLCEGFLVIFPLVGLRLLTSKLMRVGLLLQASIGGLSLVRSLLDLFLEGFYDPQPHLDLVYLVFRSLPLVMSGLLALSMLCFSYGLAPWRFPSDLGWTLLQVVGSAVGGVLVLNVAIGSGIDALIQGTFPENEWVFLLAAGTFATFASLVVLLRPACWKRSWSLTIWLALGGGGVMILLTLGFYIFLILPDGIDITDYPTFFAPYFLMALACILVVRSERLHQKKHTKQTTF